MPRPAAGGQTRSAALRRGLLALESHSTRAGREPIAPDDVFGGSCVPPPNAGNGSDIGPKHAIG